MKVCLEEQVSQMVEARGADCNTDMDICVDTCDNNHVDCW